MSANAPIGRDAVRDAMREKNLRHVLDAIAMSPEADPFYCGSEGQFLLARWFCDLWQEIGSPTGVHLRRLHYQILSSGTTKRPDGSDYENNQSCWNFFVKSSRYARHLDLVPPCALIDRRNPKPRLFAFYPNNNSIPSVMLEDFPDWHYPRIYPTFGFVYKLPKPIVNGYVYTQFDQPFHLELWVEKSTMDDVLSPLCCELHVNYVTSVGFQSITGTINLLQRLERLQNLKAGGKPVRIFYVSDYDRAGKNMPLAVARMAEFYKDTYAPNADFKLQPIVLTEEQVDRYQLPKAPDTNAVELDALEALHPGELRRIVHAAIDPYLDDEIESELEETQEEAQEAALTAWQEMTRTHRDELEKAKKKINAITDKYDQKLAKMDRELQEKLREPLAVVSEARQALQEIANEFDFSPPERPESYLGAPDESDFLFDSELDYWEQLEAYKVYKKRTGCKGVPKVAPRSCIQCGKSFIPRRRADAKLCSNACRVRAKRLARRQEVPERACAICGRLFTPKRSATKTCSQRCHLKAWRQRHK